MKKRLLLALIAALTLFSATAQDLHTAPTLQIGLGGIDFTKGTIDKELLAEIIAEKQEELKKELIKKMLLKSIGFESELFYSYVNRSIDIIANEGDPDILSKNLLENTVNLAFVITYREYYNRYLENNATQRGRFETAVNYTALQTPSSPVNGIASYDIFSMSNTLTTNSGDPDVSLSGEDANNLEEYSDFPFVLSIDENTGRYLDMVAEAIRRNETLKKLGLMRTNYLSDNISFDANEELVIQDIVAHLNQHLEYFAYIKTMLNLGSDHATITSNLRGLIATAINYDDLKTEFVQLQSELLGDSIGNRIKVSMQILNSFYSDLRYINNKPLELLNRYETQVKPALKLIASKTAGGIDLEHHTFDFIYTQVRNIHANITSLDIDLNAPFIFLLESLDEFDKTATYDKYLNQLVDAGEVFLNAERRNTINKVINLIRAYIKFDDTGGNYSQAKFDIDADGFIQALQNLNYNEHRPLELHFTLGSNMLNFQSPFEVVPGTFINTYSFMSEKIGLKLKLWNWKYTRSFNRGETYQYYGNTYKREAPASKPIVSNFHFLMYGSGILYNLANTGTTSDFNYPLVGYGFGFTFYNSLDLNISWGKPIVLEQNFWAGTIPLYTNVGFDIQFSEYLQRVNKKRKAAKTQKLLANAQEQNQAQAPAPGGFTPN